MKYKAYYRDKNGEALGFSREVWTSNDQAAIDLLIHDTHFLSEIINLTTGRTVINKELS